jgi:hypothetical protein
MLPHDGTPFSQDQPGRSGVRFSGGGPDPDGKGYWLITANGTIHSFGDAPATTTPTYLNAPIVGMTAGH